MLITVFGMHIIICNLPGLSLHSFSINNLLFLTPHVTTITHEFMVDTGSNIFLLNNVTLLTNPKVVTFSVGVTGGTSATCTAIGKLILILRAESKSTPICVCNISCLPSNLCNIFPLNEFYHVCFKCDICIFHKKVALVDSDNSKHIIPFATHYNDLNFILIDIIMPGTPMPTLCSLILATNLVEVCERFSYP